MFTKMNRFMKYQSRSERYTFYTNGIVAAVSIVVSLYSILQLLLSHTYGGLIQSFILLMLGLIMSYLFANNYFYYERNFSESNRLSTRERVEKAHPFEEILRQARSVDMLSASNEFVFRDGRAVELLMEALQRGAKFRFISLKHTSPASDEFVQNKSPNIAVRQDKTVLSLIDLQFKLHPDLFKGIDYYLTEVNIPCSILIARDHEGEIFHAKVDLYAINIGGASRPCLFFEKDDQDQVRLFELQFEEVLRRSTPYLIGGQYNETLRDELLPLPDQSPRSFVVEPQGQRSPAG